jgi:hypothetical protein
VALTIAIIAAAPLLVLRRGEMAGLEASVYWLGITMLAFWAFLPMATRLNWIYDLSGASTTAAAYRTAGVFLAGVVLLSAAAILLWRRARLSGPEIAIYAMGTAAALVAVLLMV